MGMVTMEHLRPEHWYNIPYIDYLDAVDAALEGEGERTANQDEMEMISNCQEVDDSPDICAENIIAQREGGL